MSHLWFHLDGQWSSAPLGPVAIELTAGSLGAVAPAAEGAPITLVPRIDNDKIQWAIVVDAREMVHVNGDRLLLGIRVLENRDSIQINRGERLFFSTESAPVVVAYTKETPILCGLCRTDIHAGDHVVQCPSCKVFYHQNQKLSCWLYADRCACNQPTELTEDNCWRPDDE